MGSPRQEGIGATASSLSSMAASAVENISSDVAQQKLIDNACKAVKHVMYVHPCGGFDRILAHNPVVSVKALLVFKLDGKVVATLPGSLETLKGEEVYSQKVLDKHNWDRQQWSILKANPGINTNDFAALIKKGTPPLGQPMNLQSRQRTRPLERLRKRLPRDFSCMARPKIRSLPSG